MELELFRVDIIRLKDKYKWYLPKFDTTTAKWEVGK